MLGASFDAPEANKAFATEQEFGFRLLSDVERTVGAAYGVTRAPDDQYTEFPQRISYLIDPEGTVRRAYKVAGVSEHADEVLADLEALQPE